MAKQTMANVISGSLGTSFADSIGADGFSVDAASCADLALSIVGG